MTTFDEQMQEVIANETLDLMPFEQNPDPRCAAVLVLDRSYSMATNNAIDQLNTGLETLHQELLNDELASRRIELGVVSFGADVTVESEISALDNFSPPRLTASGSTPMADAMMTALHLIARQTAKYNEAGIAYYKPWILLLTDGAPTDDAEMINAAVMQLLDAQKNSHVTVFAVGVDGADFNILDKMTLHFNPKQLSSIKWSEFFIWLSNSLKKVSASNPTDRIGLDKSDAWEL